MFGLMTTNSTIVINQKSIVMFTTIIGLSTKWCLTIARRKDVSLFDEIYNWQKLTKTSSNFFFWPNFTRQSRICFIFHSIFRNYRINLFILDECTNKTRRKKTFQCKWINKNTQFDIFLRRKNNMKTLSNYSRWDFHSI